MRYFFDRLKFIDTIISEKNISDISVNKIATLLKEEKLKEYFFQNLKDDIWVRLVEYEVDSRYVNLNFEIWNKTNKDLYFSWDPQENFSMVDNKNNRYDVFSASTREVSVGKDERLKFTGHGYSTVQFNDDPLYKSGVTDLYITMEYLSEIDKATFHVSVGN